MPELDREQLMGALLTDPDARTKFALGNGPRQELLNKFGLSPVEVEVLMGIPTVADTQTVANTLLEHFGEND